MSARVITHVTIAIAIALVAPRARAAGQISVERSRATIAGTPFVISGSLAIDPPAADFRAYTPRWRLGGLALRDVVVRVRARSSGLQACLAGDALGSRLVACGALPRSLEHLDQLGAIDVTWHLDGAGATGQGSARLAWRDGTIRVEHARFELAAPARVAGAELADATIAGELAGSLAPLDLHVTARARAGTVAIAGAELADVELPIDVRVTGRELVPRTPLIAHARDATFASLGFVAPTLAIRGGSLDALEREPLALAWSAVAGLPFDAGAGSATLRVQRGGVWIEDARLAALGASLAIDPFELRAGAPVEATLHVRGLPLGKMLALASDGKLEGSGLLDGELALLVDGDGATLARGALQARAAGGFRVRDTAWATRLTASIHGVEVHRRIENALSDFAYDRLALIVRPAGAAPDATLVLQGHGKRVAQELAITVNLRGVRSAARSLRAHYPSLGIP